jgi:hypothetical protein
MKSTYKSLASKKNQKIKLSFKWGQWGWSTIEKTNTTTKLLNITTIVETIEFNVNTNDQEQLEH